MIEFLKPFWIGIVKYLGIAIAVLFVLIKVRQSGSDAVKKDALEKTLDGVMARDKIEDTIVSADDIERKRLRKKWTR